MRTFGVLLPLAAAGCPGGGGDGGDGVDRCAGSDMPFIEVGEGVGDAFSPYSDGEDVPLINPPQGGFGITTRLHTEGLVAGPEKYVDLLLDLERDGVNEGTFFVPGMPLPCADPEFGGILTGAAAGLDQAKYKSNDDLLALDGQIIDIVAIVTDEDGNTATARQPVTIRVGG